MQQAGADLRFYYEGPAPERYGYKAEGAYTHKDRVVILTVMDPKQAVLLERHIQAVDPEAFLMVTKSSEIMGKGFKRYI